MAMHSKYAVADHARECIIKVMLNGDLRGKVGWEAREPVFHVVRAIIHLWKHLTGDETENHLAHAQTRIAMARYLAAVAGRDTNNRLKDDEFMAGELDR